MRRKTEALLQELKRKLDEEQNKRTKEMNNNQQHNDKINSLEKQVSLLTEIFDFVLFKISLLYPIHNSSYTTNANYLPNT